MLVLPFNTGLSEKNGSYWAGRIQGTPILTTHSKKHGFEKKSNTFFCPINEFNHLQNGFDFLLEKRNIRKPKQELTWDDIASKYIDIYYNF